MQWLLELRMFMPDCPHFLFKIAASNRSRHCVGVSHSTT